MEFECQLCGQKYEIDDLELDYLLKTRMVIPLMVCKPCAIREVKTIPENRREDIVLRIGTPEGRAKEWERLFEEHPGLEELFKRYNSGNEWSFRDLNGNIVGD